MKIGDIIRIGTDQVIHLKKKVMLMLPETRVWSQLVKQEVK